MAAVVERGDVEAGGGEVGGLLVPFSRGLTPAGEEEGGRTGFGARLGLAEADAIGGKEGGRGVGSHCCGCAED